MKTKLISLVAPILAVTLQLVPSATAQQPPGKPGRHFRGEWGARWSALTEEERMKVKAAHRQAMTDPAVQAAHDRLKQARREFREVMRPAMLKADSSVQPILEKMRPERTGRE